MTSNNSTKRSILSLFTHPEKIPDAHITPADLALLENLLRPGKPKTSEKFSRLLLGKPLAKIPAKYRMLISNILKSFRNPKKTFGWHNPDEMMGNRLVAAMAEEWGFNLWEPGKNFGICLCHDVDTRKGYDFLPYFLSCLDQRKIRSSFYFVTNGDYTVEKALTAHLMEEGHEVGLHGYNHDIGIAHRSAGHIRNWLEKGKNGLGVKNCGFRSPGLSVSETLLTELKRAGFLYDSSMQTGSTLYHGTGYCYPYQMPKIGIWEAPVWFQDAFLFRDSRLAEKDALDWLEARFQQLESQRALVVFLLHPDNMVHRKDFLNRFLDKVFLFKQKANVNPLHKVIHRFQALFENRTDPS